MSPSPRTAVLALILSGSFASGVAAQSGQFRLDEGGNWVAVESRPLSADEQRIMQARELLADNKPGGAKRILDAFIEEYQHTSNPLLASAYLYRGDALALDGDEFEALYDYEVVAKDFVASEEFPKAIERELQIGIRYLHGLKRKLWGLRWVDATDIGEELLIRVQERMPNSRLAERAAIELADHYYRIRNLDAASDMYEVLIANFPESQHISWARQRRIHANIGRFKGPNYDATGLRDAKVLIEEYETIDPASARRAGLSDALMARLDESMAAQMLEKARWYTRRGDLVSARFVLNRLVVKHPQTVSAATGLQIIRENGWEAAAPDGPRDEGPAGGVEARAPEAGAE
jgi:tetratricopeptide (TPR) repeat protein